MKSFLQEVSRGLSKKNKKLSSKWFYDFHGSKLFEQITRLKEYYPTRTEKKILKDNKIEIANKIGKRAVLIEPGACLLYTSPSPRDIMRSRMPSAA